eukprot:1516930-Amphidinium_carterae.1
MTAFMWRWSKPPFPTMMQVPGHTLAGVKLYQSRGWILVQTKSHPQANLHVANLQRQSNPPDKMTKRDRFD